MSTLTSQFDLVLNAIIDNEKRSARRIGKHVDDTKAALRELKEAPAPKALPAASDFKGMTDSSLKRLLKAYGVKGYTTRNGVRLKKDDRIALAIEHGVPALSFDFLLNFYLTATR